MRLKIYTIAASLILFGCGDNEREFPTPNEQHALVPLQFEIELEKNEMPFVATKGMPTLNIPEPTAINNGEEESVEPSEGNLFDRIDYIVYKNGESNELVKRKQFKLGDPDFTIIYDSLPEGKYNICFLAHSDKGISITGQTAQFSKVSDAFHLAMQQDIKAGERIVKDVNLKRIVSRIEFVSTDAVSEQMMEFSINVGNYQDKIDIISGLGISEGKSFSSSYIFKPSDVGKRGMSHSFMTFVPANSSKLTTSITAKDKLGAIRRNWNVNDVTPIANKTIRYTGILYTPKVSDDTFTIDIINGGKWDAPVENQLKE